MGAPPLDAVIVGTPRSGTTLVQRLVDELEGVVVPPETHFLALHALSLLRRRTFPLGPSDIREELEAFLALPTSRGLDIDAASVASELGGSCGSLWDLFAAIVRDLAGPAAMVGEKTPEHLWWWRPLTIAWPETRLVAIVRDPRDVVASSLEVPFGMAHVPLLAERWRADQADLVRARRELPAGRMLLLRYEDLTAAPDAVSGTLATFLDTPATRGRAGTVRVDWEHWKEGVDGPIERTSVGSWRQRLDPDDAATVTRICRDGMRHFGYVDHVDGVQGRPRLPRMPVKRARFRLARARMRRRIEAVA